MRIEISQIPEVDYLPDEGYYVERESGLVLSPDEFHDRLRGTESEGRVLVEPYLRPLHESLRDILDGLESLVLNMIRGSKWERRKTPEMKIGETQTSVHITDISKWHIIGEKYLYLKEDRVASCLGSTENRIYPYYVDAPELTELEMTQLKELSWAFQELFVSLAQKIEVGQRPLLPFHEEVVTGVRALANDLPCPSFSLVEALQRTTHQLEDERAKNVSLQMQIISLQRQISSQEGNMITIKELARLYSEEHARCRRLDKASRRLRARRKLSAEEQIHRQ
jgi:hypothetical protein